MVAAPLPLFPLNTPLVPGLVLPLHIFEHRYRDLVAELLAIEDEDAREFGVVAIRDGRIVERDGIDALYPIGTATVLRQAELFDDGRYDIVTTGSRRFRLLGVDDSEPLLRAQVEFLDD
ncbi:MAG: LON peptidase substrate-binding domain-containing protein, partial [Actinobacteria bacterium]|nr:LON peptidase substrate-binding domain-containing protein [Actinomycetota bacterium]